MQILHTGAATNLQLKVEVISFVVQFGSESVPNANIKA